MIAWRCDEATLRFWTTIRDLALPIYVFMSRGGEFHTEFVSKYVTMKKIDTSHEEQVKTSLIHRVVC
jgi:hypothetical protein